MSQNTKKSSSRRFIFLLLFIVAPGTSAWGGTHDQAKRLHNRLTGVPPAPAVLAQMEGMLNSGNPISAAMAAMDTDSFYNVMLRNWFSTWTNVAENQLINLNDYSATAIGMIRDNISFDQALYGDILYVGDDRLATTLNADGSVATQRLIMPYLNSSNQHYIDIDNVLINPADVTDLTSAARNKNISLKQFLVKKQQSMVTGIPDTAGLLTTRAFGEAYFSAGTNRRAFRFAMRNFLCLDMQNIQDTSRADFRVRRDVDRAPGGDSRTYKQTCVGCHSGMDAVAGAFAYFDFSSKDGVLYTPGKPQDKYNKNGTVFPAGYVTTDNSWFNLWTTGPDAFVGWNGLNSGYGARALGQMLSQTNAFPTCMVKRVFKRVCLRDPTSTESDLVQSLATGFSKGGLYNMKQLFATVATLPQCMGE